MEPRIDYLKVGRGVYEAMLGLEEYLDQCGLDETLLDLIKLRVSHVNGCDRSGFAGFARRSGRRARKHFGKTATFLAPGLKPESCSPLTRP